MKICPWCQTQNPDSAVLCVECMNSIGGIAPEPKDYSENFINDFFKKEEICDRRHSFFLKLVMLFYCIICIPVYVLIAINNGPFFLVVIITLFFLTGYYLCVFKAEFLFKLNHFTCIDNIDDVEISDYYFLSNKIGGFLMLVAGICFAVYVCIKVIS